MSRPLKHPVQKIYADVGRPMQVVFFASGGPGNFAAALRLARLRPDLLEVALLVTDRPRTPSSILARANGCPVIEFDYDRFRQSGDWNEVAATRDAFHSRMLEAVLSFERLRGRALDLAVLAYRRIWSGPLFSHFKDRAINQHPADLSILDDTGSRRFTGIGGLRRALESGATSSRTCTIMVGAGVDTGEILCRGPAMPLEAIVAVDDQALDAIEAAQKAHSDWPSLQYTLLNIALGHFALRTDRRHPDGARIVTFDGHDLPYSGVDVPECFGASTNGKCLIV